MVDESRRLVDANGAVNVEGLIGGSESGLPAWAEKYVANILDKYAQPSWRLWNQSINKLAKAPEDIEKARVALNSQYARDIQTPTMNAVRSALAQGFGRGTASSSMFGDNMQRVSAEAMRSAASQQTQSNVWAANARLQNLMQMVQARGQMAGLLGDYLNATRFSYATDPSAAGAYLSNLSPKPGGGSPGPGPGMGGGQVNPRYRGDAGVEGWVQ